MTRHVVDLELEVYKPDNSSSTPDHTVPAADVEGLQINDRLQKLKDTGEIHLDNTGGKWADKITLGDKLRLRTQLDGEASLSHRWTGLCGPRTIEQTTPSTSQLRMGVTDFVFGVLAMRTVYNAFEGRAISGSSSAIVNTILANEASEIDRSKIQSVSTQTSVFYNGKNLLDAVIELANQGDAILGSDDTSLIFKPLSAPSTKWALESTDYYLPVQRNLKDTNFANAVRVEGGKGTGVADDQNTKDGYLTVTDSTRLTHQLSTAKSEIARVEVWTRTTGSGDNVVVRLQSNDAGAPWDVSNREADIARKELAADFLASDGLTTFLFPSHALPDPDPWLIIESDGSTGQDIGVNTQGTSGTSDDTPRFEAYYPYEIATRTSDQQSIKEYRRREVKIRDDNLRNRESAKQVATSKLDHDARPESEVRFEAQSVRAHNLATGDLIDVSLPNLDAAGTHIAIERADDYNGSTLKTDLTVQDTETI